MSSRRASFDSAIDVTDASEDEMAHFPFMKLPGELRIRVYEMLFKLPHGTVIDLDPLNYRRLAPLFLPLFLTSRKLHREASEVFYGANTFRVFSTTPRFINTKKSLLTRLPRKHRGEVTSMELRLGPGWHKPPRSWVINDALGLSELVKLKTLNIFVEVDPASDAVFEGFRQTSSFYTDFCVGLLRGFLQDVPSIAHVQLDCWLSIGKLSPLMTALKREAEMAGKGVTWGSEVSQLDEFEEIITRISSLTSLTDAMAMAQIADGSSPYSMSAAVQHVLTEA